MSLIFMDRSTEWFNLLQHVYGLSTNNIYKLSHVVFTRRYSYTIANTYIFTT